MRWYATASRQAERRISDPAVQSIVAVNQEKVVWWKRVSKELAFSLLSSQRKYQRHSAKGCYGKHPENICVAISARMN